MLPKYATHSKLFLMWTVFTSRAFWDHCQQNWTISTYLTPIEPENWPLTFSSITTKRYVVDRSNLVFLNRYNKRNLLVWFLTTLKKLWIWPLYKISCDPQASCTGCDIMKLSNLLFLFSWVNFRSVRPTTSFNKRFWFYSPVLFATVNFTWTINRG